MGFYELNEEQKIRLSLSEYAMSIMYDDMNMFNISKPATFINTVFENFRDNARSSVSLYLQNKQQEHEQAFAETSINSTIKKQIIETLINQEEKEEKDYLNELTSAKRSNCVSRIYHVNDINTEYLQDDCTEDKYYSRAGQYIKCLIEEYCLLPFIERERIFHKKIHAKIESACMNHNIIKLKLPVNNEIKTFNVYPYKIISDPLKTQSYLVCWSKFQNDDESTRRIGSFAMSRIPEPTVLSSTYALTKARINEIEESLTINSPAYLTSDIDEIHVRLTEKGKKIYQNRLFARPAKYDALSTEDEYVFFCTHKQAFNFFIAFGDDAEIISPKSLRENFSSIISKMNKTYNK